MSIGWMKERKKEGRWSNNLAHGPAKKEKSQFTTVHSQPKNISGVNQ
jgi:hypothetical protein